MPPRFCALWPYTREIFRLRVIAKLAIAPPCLLDDDARRTALAREMEWDYLKPLVAIRCLVRSL